MKIITDLANKITNEGMNLKDLMVHQHRYHEYRRWSVENIIDQYKDDPQAKVFTREDKAALWHVIRGEATTQPGGISISVYANELAKEYSKTNKPAEVMLKALEGWLARYWLNEEGHHEAGFTRLAELANMEDISDEELIAHRQYFPADKIGRKLILQACVEIEVAVSYSHTVKNTKNPLVREIFRAVQKDESQHRLYFISFAKGLLDVGVVPLKDILSMAYSWTRPGGDTYNTEREKISQRNEYINWWETVDNNSQYQMADYQYKSQQIHAQKEASVYQFIKFITNRNVSSVSELKQEYLNSLMRSKRVA